MTMHIKKLREQDEVKFSLRLKLILTMVLLVLLSISIAGLVSMSAEKEALIEQVKAGNLEIAKLIANEIDKLLYNAKNVLRTTTTFPVIWGMNKEKISPIIKGLIGSRIQRSIFNSIYVLDTDSNLVFYTNKPECDLSKLWYMTVVKGGFDGYISEVFYKDNNKPYMFISIPIRNKLFEIIGILVAELDLTYLNNSVVNVNVKKTGYAYIIDNRRRILAHRETKLIGTFLNPAYDLYTSMIGPSGNIEFKDKTGEYQIAAFVNLAKYKGVFNPGWYVIVQQSRKEAYSAVFKLREKIITIAWILFAATLVISIFLGLSITVPLKKLVKEVKYIAEGDLTRELNINTGDEIEVLARNFNQMRKNLKENIEELDLLYKVGQSMSSELDYTKVLNLILDKLISVMKAESGSIMIFDEDSGKLKIEVAKGLPENIIEKTEVAVGEGIVGKVMKTGRPIYIANTMDYPDLAKIKGREVKEGTFLSVPLRVKGELRGVINVSKSTPNSFTDRDLELFRSLSIQAAIAYENARLYKLAITDGLTKLYIHRYFQSRLDEELRRAKRYRTKVTLIMTDIDHFKNFNDTYGHQIGDKVLKTVASILSSSIRNVDIIARYGGEEFAVICPAKGADDILIAAERMRKSIEEYEFYVENKRVPLTISLGIASYPEHAVEKMELIEKADMALYKAKESGRNRVCIYGR